MRPNVLKIRRPERGATLVLIATALVALLSVMSLALDLGLLYVARNEAQRAADAAALAGADIFLTQGCTALAGGCVAGGPQEAPARAQAEAIGKQNLIAGQNAGIQDADIAFSYPTAEEPQISVTVARTGIPTLFAKMFGVLGASVKVTAMAEAYNPSGGGANISLGCIAPFLVPNCDPNPNDSGPKPDPNCPGDNTVFINPANGAIQTPGVYSAGGTGVIGQPWLLHSNAGPSLWYLVQYPGESGSQLRDNIISCAPTPISCGDTILAMNGNKVGPTTQGVDARINANGDGLGQGQDVLVTANPLLILGGANNPNPLLVGKDFSGPSASIVTVPVYDGQKMHPGNNNYEKVVGFMQLFIRDATHNATDSLIDTVIVGLSGCGQPGTTPTVVDSGGSPIPIRLIHP